jgi:hypothetical protein
VASINLGMRDFIVAAVSFAAASAAAGLISMRRPIGTKPISDCEANCIRDNPDDTQARLNCMLKCVADGKLSFADVLTRNR